MNLAPVEVEHARGDGARRGMSVRPTRCCKYGVTPLTARRAAILYIARRLGMISKAVEYRPDVAGLGSFPASFWSMRGH
jgi:hypothetical protein